MAKNNVDNTKMGTNDTESASTQLTITQELPNRTKDNNQRHTHTKKHARTKELTELFK